MVMAYGFSQVFYVSEKLHSWGNVILCLSQPGKALENGVSYFAHLPHTGSDPVLCRCKVLFVCLF